MNKLFRMKRSKASARNLSLEIGNDLFKALSIKCQEREESLNHYICRLLAEELDIDYHTIYQVSTTGALVKGVYKGCVKVGDIIRHGDFGIGTFDNLDGEAILLDGVCWHACSNGLVAKTSPEIFSPFFVATFFTPEISQSFFNIDSKDDMTSQLNKLRISDNIFTAIRVRGLFERITLRIAAKSKSGVDLVEAIKGQKEIELENISGTLVGFWTPKYVTSINVPGYHFHFISEDHKYAGHLFDLRASKLSIELHHEQNLHLALSDSTEFLNADLSLDPSEALKEAE